MTKPLTASPRAAVLASAALTLAMLLVAGCGAAGDHAPPEAVRGTLDLSQAEPSFGPVRLEGQWAYYPGQLLAPADFEEGPATNPTYMDVPACWSAEGGAGFGTYRLRVLLPPDREPLSITLGHPHSAYRMWVDGVLRASGGTVGTSAASESAWYVPAAFAIPAAGEGAPRGDALDIVVQVSNFHFRCGGLTSAPILGATPQVAAWQARSLAVDTVAFGAMVIMGLYHLILFAFRREERAALHFGLFALLLAVRVPFLGQAFLLQLEHGLPIRADLTLEYGADYLALPAFLGLLQSLYPQETSRWAVRASQAAAALGLLSLLGPTRLSSRLILPYEALVAVAILYSLGVVILAAIRRREGAVIFLVGAAAFFAALVNDLLNDNLLAATGHLAPVGVVVLLLAQSVILARRFLEAFRESHRSQRLLAEHDDRVRKDVAELLHGRVQAGLVAVGRALGEAADVLRDDGNRALDVLAKARADLERIREDDVRQASHRLHPTAIDIGLVPAVEALARSFGGHLDVSVEVDDAAAELDRSLESGIPADVRLAAYRTIEEGLNNVLLHAEAHSATVRLTLAPRSTLAVAVSDDGRGLAGAPPRMGLGLRGINARVTAAGGRWEIAGRRGRGTTLRAWFPLR